MATRMERDLKSVVGALQLCDLNGGDAGNRSGSRRRGSQRRTEVEIDGVETGGGTLAPVGYLTRSRRRGSAVSSQRHSKPQGFTVADRIRLRAVEFVIRILK